MYWLSEILQHLHHVGAGVSILILQVRTGRPRGYLGELSSKPKPQALARGCQLLGQGQKPQTNFNNNNILKMRVSQNGIKNTGMVDMIAFKIWALSMHKTVTCGHSTSGRIMIQFVGITCFRGALTPRDVVQGCPVSRGWKNACSFQGCF